MRSGKHVVLFTLVAMNFIEQPAPEVTIEQGTLSGRISEDGLIFEYLGIPYATTNENARFKVWILLCYLASSHAIVLWSHYPAATSSHLFGGLSSPAVPLYDQKTIQYLPDPYSKYDLPNFEDYGSSVTSFVNPKTIYVPRVSKTINAPSQSSHFLINEGLSAYASKPNMEALTYKSYKRALDEVPVTHVSYLY
ncbi:uncharacterized protein LOC134651356 isoform X2 [Cydia amplana]|uniref:uncharacterized protein LOC134651356 isoform X2 n=1 Tax=Cydia amplana TaxID=1869771 RepID=UPI002FE5DBA6